MFRHYCIALQTIPLHKPMLRSWAAQDRTGKADRQEVIEPPPPLKHLAISAQDLRSSAVSMQIAGGANQQTRLETTTPAPRRQLMGWVRARRAARINAGTRVGEPPSRARTGPSSAPNHRKQTMPTASTGHGTSEPRPDGEAAPSSKTPSAAAPRKPRRRPLSGKQNSPLARIKFDAESSTSSP